MAKSRPGGLYTWVTWLTSLLAGDAQCFFAPWFKSRHTYEKVPRDFDVAAWTAEHTAMVRKRVAELKADGWTCTVENQNQFRIVGKSTTLAGKMDIVAVQGERILVIDCKSGQQRDSDWWQVLIYLFVLPMTKPTLTAGRIVEGEVTYKSRSVPVPPEMLTEARRTDLIDLLRLMASPNAPEAVPSAHGCNFCDIPKSECPVRFGEGTKVDILTSEF